jgi:proline dehydrogenase
MHRFPFRLARVGVPLSALYVTHHVLQLESASSATLKTDQKHTTYTESLRAYYASKPTSELWRSLFVYTVSSSPILVALGKSALRLCETLHVPFIYEGIARHTFYRQFCGGETVDEVKEVIMRMQAQNAGVILNYVREEDEVNEAAFERTVTSMLRTIEAASVERNNFCAIKLSSLVPVQALKEQTRALRNQGGPSHETQSAMRSLEVRLDRILNYARDCKVKILVDAEQDALQPAIDQITMQLSRRFNKDAALCYNTYQCYLKASLRNLSKDLEKARREGWFLGAKIVRGAYLASEPRHLIHDTKQDTDTAFDDALRLLARQNNVEILVATHHANSLALAAYLVAQSQVPIRVAQLYGMSGALSWHLRSQLQGETQVYAYLPWGTVSESMKYLLRRADENVGMVERGRMERDEIWHQLVRRLSIFN